MPLPVSLLYTPSVDNNSSWKPSLLLPLPVSLLYTSEGRLHRREPRVREEPCGGERARVRQRLRGGRPVRNFVKRFGRMAIVQKRSLGGGER